MSRQVILALSTIFAEQGGIPRFNRLLCRSFDELAPELGFRGTVVSQDDRPADYERHGSPWRCLSFMPGGGKQRTIRATLGLCLRQRSDALVIGHLGMAPLGLLCRPWLRRGYVFVAHGTEAWDVPRWTRRLAARKASSAWTVSDYTGRLLARATGMDLSRTRLLPNALEPALQTVKEPARSEAGGPGLEVLSVARLDPGEREKGIDHTIQVLATMGPRYPDLRYRIVGRGGDKPRLVELARSHRVADRVIFEEGLTDEELVERYRSCDVFVLPSGQEGFGIVFLEAMRFGKPCIGGAAGGTPEVVVHDKTGLLVPFGDLAALENALERLLGDGELRQSMGEQGRIRVEERFVFARYRERVESLLREWLGIGDRRAVHSSADPQ